MPDPNPPEDNLTGESRALPYDPASAPRDLEEVTLPTKPQTSRGGGRWPSLLIIGAALVLLGAALLLLIVSSDAGRSTEFARQPITPVPCLLEAAAPVNVRSGPDYAYERVWIWDATNPERAYARLGVDWYRIGNGWVPAETVTPGSQNACNALPEDAVPVTLYDDDIEPPREVVALGWAEQLGENFATDVNGWVTDAEAEVAAIRRGYLALFALDNTRFPLVSPRQMAQQAPLREAYYTFRIQWVASSRLAETFLLFQSDGEQGYRLGIRRDGHLTLVMRQADGGSRVLATRALPPIPEAPFEVGVLSEDNALTVYLNDDIVLTVTENPLPPGALFVGVVGQNTTVYIDRFEITRPPDSSP